MPRPKNGYTNAAGQPVPGTTDVTGRYKDSGALIHWAHKQGAAGLPLYDRSAIDIGSAVHKMAELDLIGAPDREIEAALHNYLSAPNHLQMAHASFKAFREWREQCRVTPIKQEISLVSERYQYGGTPDLIAMVNNGIGLIDFKTGKAVYNEMKVALAWRSESVSCCPPCVLLATSPKLRGQPRPVLASAIIPSTATSPFA